MVFAFESGDIDTDIDTVSICMYISQYVLVVLEVLEYSVNTSIYVKPKHLFVEDLHCWSRY